MAWFSLKGKFWSWNEKTSVFKCLKGSCKEEGRPRKNEIELQEGSRTLQKAELLRKTKFLLWHVQGITVCIFSLSKRRFTQEIAYITESCNSYSHVAFSVYVSDGCGSPIYSCSVFLSKHQHDQSPFLLQYIHHCHFLPVFRHSNACALCWCKESVDKSPRCEQGAD